MRFQKSQPAGAAKLVPHEGLAWQSVVLPLPAQVFASCFFSSKPAINGVSIKIMILNDL
jgi:hypothetical protein